MTLGYFQLIRISLYQRNNFEFRRTENRGSRVGPVVRALASHQCGPGSIPGVDTIILWAEVAVGFRPCSKCFSPGTLVFLPPQKPTFPNSNSTWKQWIEEQLCGCATEIPIYCYYLDIIIIIIIIIIFSIPWDMRP